MAIRPVWLRWQPIRFSSWLVATVFGWGILYTGLLIAPYWRSNDGDLIKLYFAAVKVRVARGPSAIEVALSVLLTAGLFWFTYFSKNSRVKDHDKFAVFLMFCGAAAGWSLMLVRYFLRG